MPEARIKPNALSDRILQKPKIHAFCAAARRHEILQTILGDLKSQDIVISEQTAGIKRHPLMRIRKPDLQPPLYANPVRFVAIQMQIRGTVRAVPSVGRTRMAQALSIFILPRLSRKRLLPVSMAACWRSANKGRKDFCAPR